MTDKEKTIKELKEALDSLDITNKYRLNIIRAIEYLQEEPVSEELEEIAWNHADKKCHLDIAVFTPDEVKKERGKMQFTWQDLYDAVIFGAQSQKAKDQSTTGLAEEHAMLAGMNKMEQQMIAGAIETTFNVSLPSGLYDKLLTKGCKEGDKLLVIK